MFDPEKFYRPQDEEMRKVASVGTLAQWRYRGNVGPPYIKIGGGGKILYEGRALNDWLAAHRVEPRQD